MKVELPDLKLCCCCIPLRPGLLVWGYLRLALLTLLMAHPIFCIAANVYTESKTLVFSSLFLLAMTPEVGLTGVYLIGVHQKSPKILFISYIGNIVIFFVDAVFLTSATVYSLYRFGTNSLSGRMMFVDKFAVFLTVAQSHLGIMIFYLGAVMYTIILLKSEMNKLNNSNRFGNDAVEEGNRTNEQGVTLKETNLEQYS